MLEFSIHAPTRGATLCDQRHGKQFGFSIHAPTRGATVYCLRDIIFIKLFNPRSHERSDSDATATASNILFSIHAPTRGATGDRDLLQLATDFSIHAPTRGATAILHKKFVYFYTIPTINI